MSQGLPDPVPLHEPVLLALSRVRTRWEQLPLATAELKLGVAEAAWASFLEPGVVAPASLGPASAMDQLTVLVYDACQGAPGAARLDSTQVAALLAHLLRELA